MIVETVDLGNRVCLKCYGGLSLKVKHFNDDNRFVMFKNMYQCGEPELLSGEISFPGLVL